MEALIGFLFSMAFYLLPSIVAFCRHHQNSPAILILNLLLGWTIIGWIIALVWAFTKVEKEA